MGEEYLFKVTQLVVYSNLRAIETNRIYIQRVPKHIYTF